MALLTRPWRWAEAAKDPRGALIADLVLAIGVAVFAIFWYLDGQQTKRALCDLRGDVAHRAAGAHSFLDAHPNQQQFRFGDVAFSRQQLEAEVDGQDATLRSLAALHC